MKNTFKNKIKTILENTYKIKIKTLLKFWLLFFCRCDNIWGGGIWNLSYNTGSATLPVQSICTDLWLHACHVFVMYGLTWERERSTPLMSMMSGKMNLNSDRKVRLST